MPGISQCSSVHKRATQGLRGVGGFLGGSSVSMRLDTEPNTRLKCSRATHLSTALYQWQLKINFQLSVKITSLRKDTKSLGVLWIITENIVCESLVILQT